MEFDEFLTILESIVEAGTKIDISFFLHDNMDEDQENEVIDYLKSTEEDNLESAIQELGGEIEEEYIRLVRLMFISELGN